MTSAPATIASSEVAAYPCSVKSRSATSTSARRVVAEYCARRLVPGTCGTVAASLARALLVIGAV